MAGIDGVERRIDPAAAGYGPVETNFYHLEENAVRLLPASLEEALEELKADNAFLTRDGVFPESLLENWQILKSGEHRHIQTLPTPGEYALYYDC